MILSFLALRREASLKLEELGPRRAGHELVSSRFGARPH